MKKKLLFLLPLLAGVTASLSACGKGDTGTKQLTFNRYITNKANSLFSLSQDELIKRMSSKGSMHDETFIIFFHPENTLCSCYQHSLATLQDYVYKYHINVYDITFEEILSNENTNKYGLHFKTGDRSHVHLALVSKGKVIDQFTYTEDSPLAKTEYLKVYLEKRLTFDSKLAYVDQGYLDSLTIDSTRTDDYIVSYMRTTCEDCAVSTPIIAFEKEVNKDVYFFDLDPLRNAGDSEAYQTFKDDHYLSNKYNEALGYANSGGVVPTLHYYSNSALVDACVVFNNSISKKEGTDDKYIVTDSYYSEERLENLHYMDDVEIKVLKGRELDATEDEIREVTIEYPKDSGNYYTFPDWSRDGQLKYHRPILDAFFATYAM